MLLNASLGGIFNAPLPLPHFIKNQQHFCIRLNLSEKYECFIECLGIAILTKVYFSLLSTIHYTEVSVDPSS